MERLQQDPVSRYPRELVSREVYVTVRDALAPPAGQIVEEVFFTNAEGRIPVRHDAESAPGILDCDRFHVELLDPFGNIDLLVYTGLFLSACIKVFEIEPARRENDNLRPVRELQAIWWEAKEVRVWPDADSLQALNCPGWMIALFGKHPRATNKPSARDRPWIPGFQDLFRELSHDTQTTQLILKEAKRHRSRFPSLTDGDIVNALKADLSLSCFANAGKWAEEVSPTNAPNWFGFAYRQIVGAVDRVIAELSGRPRAGSVESPWKAGKALLQALTGLPGITGTLEEMLRVALDQGRISVLGSARSKDPLQSAFTSYLAAKEKFATGRYYMALSQAERHLLQSPDQEQRQ